MPVEPTPASTAQGRMRGPRSAPSLKARALRYLSRREYSRQELQRKLQPYLEPEQSESDIEAVLDWLCAKGFLNDERAAQSVVRQKSARMGQARLKQELLAKGLDKELVHECLQELGATEFERAMQVWKSKFAGSVDWVELSHSAPQEALKAKAKQIRFLSSRGFTADVVRKVMEQVQRSGADGFNAD